MPATITPALLAHRHERARRLLDAAGLDALVAYSAPRGLAAATRTSGNVGRLAAFTPMWAPSLFVLTKARAIVVAAGKNEARLHTARASGAVEVLMAGPHGFAGRIATVLADEQAARIGSAGFDEIAAALAAAVGTSLPVPLPLDREIQELRLHREPEETALHRRAAAISDHMIARAFAVAARRNVVPAALMAEIEYQGRLEGADVSRLWLSTGPAPPVTCFEMFELASALRRGERVQLGTMVSVEGYFAQGLRIASLGPPSAGLLAAVDAVLAIQDEALALLRPGRPIHELVDLIEARIDAVCPFSRETDPFRFQSCHGLGLDYSEPGLAAALAPGRERKPDAAEPVVTPGMVFEIHPNFSLPELGHICAGDMALVTPTGAEWLTNFPRGVFRIE